MAKKKISVKGQQISMLDDKGEAFFSLTDMAKKFGKPATLIARWIRNKETIKYLGAWEELENPSFKVPEFEDFMNKAGGNTFDLSPQLWIKKTGAIGIRSKSGRGGGTYAHKDIAYHFGMWLSPVFQLYLTREFDRLKALEVEQLNLNRDFSINKILNNLDESIHLIEENVRPKKKN